MDSKKLKTTISTVAGIVLILIIFLIYSGILGGNSDGGASDSDSQNQVTLEATAVITDEAESEPEDEPTAVSSYEPTVAPVDEPAGQYTEYHFRSRKLLSQHYEKHGIEMGFDSEESYEKAASDVINNPKALHKLEAEDGDHVYYVEETNEFAILSTDGFLRTYFLPSAGKAYFDRQ